MRIFTSWFNSNLLIAMLVFSILGCLGYQIYEDQKIQNEKVPYFLKNTEILQRRQLEDLPKTAIPFYGDSLVQGLAVSRANSRLVNFGIGHDRSENLLSRMRKDLQFRQFSEYAVAVGINDINGGVVVGDLYHNILKMVESLTFADAVYLHTVLPVAENRANARTVNRKVKKINDLLLELPANHQNVAIINTYRTFSADGFLPNGLHIGDGLHLNSTANRKWAELLSAALMR